MKEFLFTVDKDRLLASSLLFITFGTAYSFFINSTGTAAVVCLLQFIFVVLFLLCYRNLSAITFIWRTFKIESILLLSWIVLSTLSTFLEDNLLQLLPRQIIIFQATLFCFCVASYFSQSRYPLSIYFISIPLSMMFMSFIFLLVYNLGPSSDAETWEQPIFANWPRHLGFIASIGSVISAYSLLTQSRLKSLNGCFHTLLFLCNFAFLVWLGGRGALYSVVACLIIVTFLLLLNRQLKLSRLALIISCVLIASMTGEKLSLGGVWGGVFHRIFTIEVETGQKQLNTNKKLSASDVENSLNRVSYGRINMWKIALNAAMEKPYLGLGSGGYYFIPDRPPESIQPHGMFVQFFTEWGILGGGSFILLLMSAAARGCYRIRKHIKSNDNAYVYAGLTILVLTLHGVTDGTYFHSQPIFYLALSFAVFPYQRLREDECGYAHNNIINR